MLPMIPYVATTDYPEADQIKLLVEALDVALESESVVIVLGRRVDDNRPLVCTCGCAWGSAGALLLIPDVLVIEGMAHGHSAADDAKVTRSDGRSAVVLKMLPGSRPPS